jgi:hypothetical protein
VAETETRQQWCNKGDGELKLAGDQVELGSDFADDDGLKSDGSQDNGGGDESVFDGIGFAAVVDQQTVQELPHTAHLRISSFAARPINVGDALRFQSVLRF